MTTTDPAAFLLNDRMAASYVGPYPDAVLALAAFHAAERGDDALILFPEWTPAVNDRRHHILEAATDARFNVNTMSTVARIGHASGGRVDLGYLSGEDSELRYKASQYQFIGYAGLPHTERAGRYFLSKLRRRAGIPVNPGGLLRLRAAVNTAAEIAPWWNEIEETRP